MRREKPAEATVAAAIVVALEEVGLDVYQEVEVRGGVIDIVALDHPRQVAHAVEVKVGMSLAALVQARDRRAIANRVWLATTDSHHAALAADAGVGTLTVYFYGSGPMVHQSARAPLALPGPSPLFRIVRPEHKTHARAGAPSAAGRWTKYRGTCEALRAIVAAAAPEPMLLATAVTELDAAKRHHYRNRRAALASLTAWAQAGKIDGVEVLPGLPVRLRLIATP